jgi:hypothetical protein
MTRMSREFSLVLLGSGLLTAGYFAWPEQDFDKRTEEQARKRVGGSGTSRSGGMFFIYHGVGGGSSSVSGGRSPAMASVSKGGFGSIGGRVGGGFGG